ncbi:alpha/beta hydrolase [Radiobacillus deserti]|nr:alpha/beta hydrolase-fold protein [Radiobacillus deserti]
MQKTKVHVQGTEQFFMTSKHNRRYRIMVYRPQQEAPASGFPILYVLDGNAFFTTVTDAIRLQSRRSDKTGVVPTVVVGIGYDSEEPFDKNRFYDYTVAPAEDQVSSKFTRKMDDEQGGANEFLMFLQEELKPKIERELAIDSEKQAIFGHSLGGLFVLHALFTQTSLFQTYIAGSPSIHWNQVKLSQEEEHFIQNNCDEKVSILIGAGELEGEHHSKMLMNARELAQRLQQLKHARVEAYEFPDENHISVVLPLINKAIRFCSDDWKL